MQHKTVIVRPELCVGCMQCAIRCAQAHSATKELATAVFEPVLAKPRIHIGVGVNPQGVLKPFPNKCRHCDPAPCQEACMPGAIRSDIAEGSKVVDPALCIGCGMCAMACPYYAIRYHHDLHAPERTITAIKCDNCHDRQKKGQIPACVEACKTGALEFGYVNEHIKKGAGRLANAAWSMQS
ncbi:MAG: 4Fe-4S dicluster domain-containing protein [Desulfovibrionaceae bacterium]|nr:4Fe-4S dicluster domain-containing protein [Desulfovibrionaceae bacterium]